MDNRSWKVGSVYGSVAHQRQWQCGGVKPEPYRPGVLAEESKATQSDRLRVGGGSIVRIDSSAACY